MSETPTSPAELRGTARSLMDLALLQRRLASMGREGPLVLAREFFELEEQLKQTADTLTQNLTSWRRIYSTGAHLLALDDRWLGRDVRLLQHALSSEPDGPVARQAWPCLDHLRPAGGLLVRRRSTVREALVRAITTEDGAVLALAPHPDGRRLFSAGADGKIRIWDGETGACLATLQGHAAAVRAMQVRPPFLFSAAADGTLTVWDVGGRTALATITAHQGAINALAALAGNGDIASAGEDGAVRTWRVPSLECAAELGQGKACLRAVAFLPDGRLLAGGGVETESVFWVGRGNGSPVVNLNGPVAAITGIAVIAAGTAVASCLDGGLYSWDGLGSTARRVPGGHRSILAVAAVPAASRVLSAGRDGLLCCVDLTSGQDLGEVGRHTGPVTSVAAWPRGRIVVSGGQDGTIAWWNARLGTSRHGHAGPVRNLIGDKSLSLLVSGGDDGQVLRWDSQGGASTVELQAAGSGVTALAEGFEEFFVGYETGRLRARSLALQDTVEEIGGHGAAITALVYEPTADLLVSAGRDATVRVWDRAASKSARGRVSRDGILPGHQGCVLALAVDGPRDLVLSGGWAREILVHSLSRQELHGHVRGHRHPIVALTVCGRTLVSADEGGQIGFCALHGLDALETKDGHRGPVTALSVTADGTTALSGSVDGRVGVWAVPERTRRHLIECGRGPIRDLAASPDGCWCAVTGDDGTVRVLSLANGEVVASWLVGSPTTACRWPGKAIVCGTGNGQMLVLDFLQPR